jgi:hypothetical protein
LLDCARQSGFDLEASSLESALRHRLNTLVDLWMQNPGNPQILEEVENVVALSRAQPFDLNLWKSQNTYYGLSQAIAGNGHGAPADWLDHFRRLGQWLGIALPQLVAHSESTSRDSAA